MLDADSWEEAESGNELWRGSSRLVLPGGERFSGKNLRVVIIDKSGQRSEREMRVSVKPPGETAVFPRAAIRDGRVRITGLSRPEVLIRLYDQEGNLAGELKTPDTEFALEGLLASAENSGTVRSLTLTVQDPDGGWVLKTAPIFWEQETGRSP